MTWSQLYYLFGSLAAVVTIFGFFKGPLKNLAAWVFQNGAKVIFTAASIAAVSLIVFSSRYYYLSSCTGEGKAKSCIQNDYKYDRDEVALCLRKLVTANRLSAKRGREIMRQWDKAKAEFESKGNASGTLPCVRESIDRDDLSSCLRKLIVSNKMSVKRGKAIMRLWDKRRAKFWKMKAEFEKKGD